MSCRSTHVGSLATTYVNRYYGLEDAMSTSLFHELRRSFEAGNIVAPNRVAFLTKVAEMEQIIRNSSKWSDALRARALARVENVFTGEMPEDSLAAAFVALDGKAFKARIAIDEFCRMVAVRLNVPQAAIQDEFKRVYKKYDRSNPDIANSIFNAALENAPKDAATLFAVGVLQYSTRCPTCGQFVGGQYSAASPHTCPAAGNRPMAYDLSNIDNRHIPISNEEEEEYEDDDWDDSYYEDDDDEDWNNDSVEEEQTSNMPAFVVEEVEPWDMEEFQNEYDAAKEKINSGNYQVPVIENPLPGQITGGLGSRIGGNSFGIELEIDFPEDEYPYEMREIFARRLYEEGIVTAPFVQRWHFIGDDRPGGNYTEDPNGWICEFDRSVDDVDGERGVEIKSQILYDEPQTWHNLNRICEIASELGASPTYRTGLHVNVGGRGFSNDDVSKHNSLLRLASAYDDVILRLAHNHKSGSSHRGRGYCSHAPIPPEGFRSISTARARSNHYQAFNLAHLPAEGERMRNSSRVEVRIWDSTLDPGRIQGAVVASLAIAKMAEDKVNPGQESEVAGSHRRTYGRSRLEGEQWEASTSSFRRFISLINKTSNNAEHHRKVLTHMFASSRWQD